MLLSFLVCGGHTQSTHGAGLTQREDLPHENTEGPNIALSGVNLVKYGLRCHPLQRQSRLHGCGDRKNISSFI